MNDVRVWTEPVSPVEPPAPTPASLTTPPSATSSGGTMQNGKIDNAMTNLYSSGSPRFGPAGFAFYAKVKRSQTKRYMRIFDFGDGPWKYNIFAALDVSSAVRHGQAKKLQPRVPPHLRRRKLRCGT